MSLHILVIMPQDKFDTRSKYLELFLFVCLAPVSISIPSRFSLKLISSIRASFVDLGYFFGNTFFIDCEQFL